MNSNKRLKHEVSAVRPAAARLDPTRDSKCQLISEPSLEIASTVGRLSTHPWWRSSSIETQGSLEPGADRSRPGRGETRVRVQVPHVIASLEGQSASLSRTSSPSSSSRCAATMTREISGTSSFTYLY